MTDTEVREMLRLLATYVVEYVDHDMTVSELASDAAMSMDTTDNHVDQYRRAIEGVCS